MNPIHPPLMTTHDVFKQAPPLENYNLYANNPALQSRCLGRPMGGSASRGARQARGALPAVCRDRGWHAVPDHHDLRLGPALSRDSALAAEWLPRWTPDGKLNEIRIQRLKDKLGDKSNAGSEVEFWGARAWLVGEEGRGVPTTRSERILKAVHVGAGLGFYGDSWAPIAATLARGEVQYIGSDHLAELTLAILHKDRCKDPQAGYTRDLVLMLTALWPLDNLWAIKIVLNNALQGNAARSLRSDNLGKCLAAALLRMAIGNTDE